jgi:signal transduction histidine kinase
VLPLNGKAQDKGLPEACVQAEPNDDVAVAPAFLSLMAHELGQPLAAALGSTYTLKERAGSNELDEITRQHLYDTAIRNLEQLQALLDSLRVFSEAEAGKLRVTTSPVGVSRLFRDAEDDFGTPLSRTRVSFDCEQKLLAQVDLMLFRQVLTNIINNAAKFSPGGSLITVEAHMTDEDTITFTVSDQGEGFPPDEAERIFGKSVRLQPGKKGLGVGLFVAKAIVEAHGGQIWAENTSEGARFSFTIPAAA